MKRAVVKRSIVTARVASVVLDNSKARGSETRFATGKYRRAFPGEGLCTAPGSSPLPEGRCTAHNVHEIVRAQRQQASPSAHLGSRTTTTLAIDPIVSSALSFSFSPPPPPALFLSVASPICPSGSRMVLDLA